MLRPHFDILDSRQQGVFKELKSFKKEAVLAGGTALALQIQHRYSFDFDLFFERELSQKDIAKLRRLLKIKKIGLKTKKQINLIIDDDLLINLVFYPFKPLFKKLPTFSLPILSLKDIALDKAYAIGRRAVWRDYVDLFFLLKSNYVSLKQIMSGAAKKFGPEFNERLFLEQLTYFKDVEIVKISFFKEKFSSSEIKNFLIDEVKKQKWELI
jgi:predicted nucleotidyltransferase component of viral defense system